MAAIKEAAVVVVVVVVVLVARHMGNPQIQHATVTVGGMIAHKLQDPVLPVLYPKP